MTLISFDIGVVETFLPLSNLDLRNSVQVKGEKEATNQLSLEIYENDEIMQAICEEIDMWVSAICFQVADSRRIVTSLTPWHKYAFLSLIQSTVIAIFI